MSSTPTDPRLRALAEQQLRRADLLEQMAVDLDAQGTNAHVRRRILNDLRTLANGLRASSKAQIEGTAATVARQTAMIEAALAAAEQRGRSQQIRDDHEMSSLIANATLHLRQVGELALETACGLEARIRATADKIRATLSAPDPTNMES